MLCCQPMEAGQEEDVERAGLGQGSRFVLFFLFI